MDILQALGMQQPQGPNPISGNAIPNAVMSQFDPRLQAAQQAWDAYTTDIQGRQLLGASLMGDNFYRGTKAAIELGTGTNQNRSARESQNLNRALDVWSTQQRQKMLAEREAAEREYQREQLAERKRQFDAELEARKAGEWSPAGGYGALIPRIGKFTEVDPVDGLRHTYEQPEHPLTRQPIGPPIDRGPAPTELQLEKYGNTPVGKDARYYMNSLGERPDDNIPRKVLADRGFRSVTKEEADFFSQGFRKAYNIKLMKELVPKLFSGEPGSGAVINWGLINARAIAGYPVEKEFMSLYADLITWARDAGHRGNVAIQESEWAKASLPLGVQSRESAVKLVNNLEERYRQVVKGNRFDPEVFDYGTWPWEKAGDSRAREREKDPYARMGSDLTDEQKLDFLINLLKAKANNGTLRVE